ncbi:MAG: OPT/YSL family transporter [Phycisphaerae bacterium]|nr:OPT/YSL family transporter [Phycisphaerae bacterium]
MPDANTPDTPVDPTSIYPPRDLTSAQLTVRAVVTGMVLGAMLSLCNIYVSLQIGWSTNMSVTGVLLAFGMWRAFEAVVGTKRPFGVLENNINQTACSAGAAVSSAGLVAPIPALALLTDQQLSWPQLSIWVFSVCLVGITAAIALRRQMIVVDKLPFPGGVASAQTLKEVYGAGTDAMRRVAMLGLGALIAGAVKIVAIFKLLPALVVPGRIAGHKAGGLGFEFDQSLLMVGVGALVGTRGACSMLAGAILAWGVIAPWALNQGYIDLKATESLQALPEGVVLQASSQLRYHPQRRLLELRGPLSADDRTTYLAMSADRDWTAAIEKLFIESDRTSASSPASAWTTVIRLPDQAVVRADGTPIALPDGLNEKALLEGTYLTVHGEANRAVATQVWEAIETSALPATGEARTAVRKIIDSLPTSTRLQPVQANFTDILEWLLWPGVTLMVVSSLVSFSFSWRSMLRAFRGSGASGGERNEGDVPMRWLGGLIVVTMIVSVLAQVLLFDIAWWAAGMGVLLSVVLAVVAARVSGETNVTPIGAMGKVTQLTFGAVLPANPAANLMTANVTGGAASQAADLLHDMKTGAMLGATPWKQAIAQICGALAGSLAGSAIYLTLIHDPHEQLLTEKWPAPAVATWKAVAELFQRGFEALPAGAANAMIVAGIVGVILPCLDRFAPKNMRPWVPSAASVGLSFVVQAKNAISIFIGAMLALVIGKVTPSWSAKFLVTLASGLIVGDALVGAGEAIASVVTGLADR